MLSTIAMYVPSAVDQSDQVMRQTSMYQSIEINHHPIYGNMLIIDGDLQISEADYEYGKAMIAPLLRSLQIGRVVIMGGSDGGVLQELLKTADAIGWPLIDATMVNIDAEVIRLCQTYLPRLNAGAYNDSRSNVLIEDAYAYIKRQRNLDAVIYDMPMVSVHPGQTADDFISTTITHIAESLRPGGILSMQCCGESDFDPVHGVNNRQLLEKIREHVDRHFSNRQEVEITIPSYQENWTFLSARKVI